MTAKIAPEILDTVDHGRRLLEGIVKRHDAAQAELTKREAELRPQVLEHLRAETRERFAAEAETTFTKYVAPSRNLPAELRAQIDPEALKRSARFDPKDETADALRSLAFGTRLANMPPRRLAELAAEIAERGDFARAGYLSDYLESRGDAIPNDVRGFAEEKLGSMAYSGPEVEALDELESLIFEAEQTVSEIKSGARRYTAEQFGAMDQETFERARKAQIAAGIKP